MQRKNLAIILQNWFGSVLALITINGKVLLPGSLIFISLEVFKKRIFQSEKLKLAFFLYFPAACKFYNSGELNAMGSRWWTEQTRYCLIEQTVRNRVECTFVDKSFAMSQMPYLSQLGK